MNSRATLLTIALFALGSISKTNVLVNGTADPSATCCANNGGQELIASGADGTFGLCAQDKILYDSWFFWDQHCNPAIAVTPRDTTNEATICCQDNGGFPGTVDGLYASYGSCQKDGVWYEAWQFYKTNCPHRPPNKEANCCMKEGGTYTLANDDKGMLGICETDHGLFEGKYFKSTYCPEVRYQVYAHNNCEGGPSAKATFDLHWDNQKKVSLQLNVGECKFVGNTVHGDSIDISDQIGIPPRQRDFQKSCEAIGSSNDQYCSLVNTNLEDGVQECVINLCS